MHPADAPPLQPDEPTGREWVLEELGRNEYLQARPNPIDEFFNDVWRWLLSLLDSTPDGVAGVNPILLLVAALIVAGVIALVVLGRPRAIARRADAPGSVFLDDDDRSAAELRAAADAAAAAGDWALAITERFRAISRALGDRTLIVLQPGTTAQGVALAAERPFPAERAALHRAADAFDAVRYLGGRGARDDAEHLRELDARLERTRPARPEPATAGAAR
ncbi:MAG: DUF4129 domain-containing protein [Microbacteriaceae bacterium]|nr:DUF4129 domain-containing protein [Microbacteriaceae bacterium]